MAHPQQLSPPTGATTHAGRQEEGRGLRGLDARSIALPAAIVAVAAVLRLWAIKYDAQNPYYDAAVRSMGLSWHNFFFGALDPSGRLGIDKPPIDLWLQVASTKLLGFTRTALALPETLGGIAGVALLYAAVTRACGRLAGALAALSLAVLPIAVLTSRSDTMDSVMSALLVAALWTSIEALRSRRSRYVLLSAALVGVAYDVKLTQALVPLPALALMWWVACASEPPRRRIAIGVGAMAVFVVVAMAWVSSASLTPLSERPFPIGSRTGSIYRAMFVFNGVERLTGASHELAPYAATSPPGLGRLVGTSAPNYATLIGLEFVAALVLLCAAALLRRKRSLRAPLGSEDEGSRQRAARWLVVALVVWLTTSYVLFSFTGHLQPRYLEAMSPAVAATLGIAGACLLARVRSVRWRSLALAGALVMLIAFPAEASIDLVEERVSDANPSGSGNQFSAYLLAHRHGARYEAAASSPLAVVGLISKDGQPVLILRTIDGAIVSVKQLRALVRERAVRFVLIPNPCTSGRHCSATISWSVRNSVMIHPGLYRYLPPSRLR